MDKKMEQRANIKFCVKLGETPKDTIDMIQTVYGREALGCTQIRMWFWRFQNGHTSLKDNPGRGRKVSKCNEENIEDVKRLLDADRRMSIKDLSVFTGISVGTVHQILHQDLGMRRLAAKFVPKVLNDVQKWTRMAVAQESLRLLDAIPDLLDQIITGDESFFVGYDPETKQQSSQWVAKGEPRPKKALRGRSRVNTMLTVFWDSQGVVMAEFMPKGETIDTPAYIATMSRLRENIRRKRPEKWAAQSFWIHHDNASPHTADDTVKALARNHTILLEHAPYSPDMAPSDFWLFPSSRSSCEESTSTQCSSSKLRSSSNSTHWKNTSSSLPSTNSHIAGTSVSGPTVNISKETSEPDRNPMEKLCRNTLS